MRDIGVTRRQDRRDRRSRRAPPRASASIAAGLHILPGVIDSQVHFREPGLDAQGRSRDRLARGGAGRRHRGVRDAQHQPADDLRRRARRQDRAARRAACTATSPSGSAARTTTSPTCPSWSACRARRGSRCSWAPRPARCWCADDAGVLAILKATRRRAAFHSEDEARLDERKGLRVAGDPSSHPVWRDEIAALRCTQRLIRLAREARAQVHVLHISTREEIALPAGRQGRRQLRGDAAPSDAERRGLRAAGDQAADEPAGARARAPRRRSGAASPRASIDVLGSDHAPHTLEEKARPYPESPSGMTGVQTLVPIMLDHVAAGRLTPATPRRPDQRRPARASSASSARAASRRATTPTSPSST